MADKESMAQQPTPPTAALRDILQTIPEGNELSTCRSTDSQHGWEVQL